MYTDDMHTHRNRKKCKNKKQCSTWCYAMVVCIWKICQFHLNRKKRSVLRDMQCANLELWNSEIRCLLFMLLLWSYTIHIAVVGVFIVENVGMLHLYEFTRQLVFRLVFLFVNFRISYFFWFVIELLISRSKHSICLDECK